MKLASHAARRIAAAAITCAGMCLATVFAATASASPPYILPPAPGVTPGAAVTRGTVVDVFYTGTDRAAHSRRRVWRDSTRFPQRGLPVARHF